jgi:glycosyltransferase involved in cell wall biosynthesis
LETLVKQGFKFSIIIPAYNVEKYIAETLNSLWNQKYNNFEIIIINDGSIDNTDEIIIKNISQRNNIKYIVKNNSGLSETRNLGINVAVGEYLIFLDSDDLLRNDTLEYLDCIIDQNHVNLICYGAKIFYGDKFSFDILKNLEFYERSYLNNGWYSGHDFYKIMNSNFNFVASSCLYCIKREFLIKKKIRFKSNLIHEDELFTRLILLNINKLYFTSEKFYFRRIRENSITQSPFSIKRIISMLIISNMLYYKWISNYRWCVDFKIDSKWFYKNTLNELKQNLNLINYKVLFYLFFNFNFFAFKHQLFRLLKFKLLSK